MASESGFWDRFVDSLPERGWFKFLSTYVVVPYWGWKDPKPKLPGGPRPSPQPSENLQRMMNLIMPLKDASRVARAWFGDASGYILGLRQQVRSLNEDRHAALEEARKNSAEIQRASIARAGATTDCSAQTNTKTS
jgi:hypothetical protein